MPHGTKSSNAPNASPQDSRNPRWSLIEQPIVQGMATFEWNIVTGLTWYSPEWQQMIQDVYDHTRPNDQEWWAERIHPEDLPMLSRSVLAIHAGFAESYETVFRFRRGDGVWRKLLTRCTVTEKTPEGAPFVASGVAIDVTELLSELGELRVGASDSKIDYHSMLENSPDLFIRFTRDVSPVYVNPAVNRYLGGVRLKDPLTGTDREVHLAGGYRIVFKKNIERVFNERVAVREELSLAMSDGSEVVGDCSFWPEFNCEGAVEFAMVQFRDLTEQRRMEQRHTLNEQRMSDLYRLTLMGNASEPDVLRFVLDSVIKLTNSRSGFFFIPEEEGSDRGYLLWSQDHYSALEACFLPDNHLPQDLLIQMTGADGNRVYRSINNGDGIHPLYVVFDGKMAVMRGIIAPGMEGNRTVCVAGVCNRESDYAESDLLQFETFINSAWLIIRRRRFIRELQKAKDAAESANKAKDAFLANVSHELRTPLNGVLSMLQLIDSMPLSREQREYLLTAQVSGKALLRIISDLLDFSSMESGKMPLAVDVFDCKESVRSALNMFADDAAQNGLRFITHIDPEIPRRLMGDEARVRQIVFNIVGNALKFTSTGSVSVSCILHPDSRPGKTGIMLLVEDTGIGIPKDKLSSIFNAFAQVENSHCRQYSGTGLGLSIVKHLAGMMGGQVTADSEIGKGTTVACSLFFDSPPSQPTRFLTAASIIDAPPLHALNILVAEDDRVGRMAIRAFLRKRGHRVVCVEDGQKALEALQVFPFDCLFTDITMPRLDGLELVRRIRTGEVEGCPPSGKTIALVRQVFPKTTGAPVLFDPGLPVVAVSAHSMIGDKERFLEQGMDFYISKPIIKEELDEAIAHVMQRLDRTPSHDSPAAAGNPFPP